MSVNEDSFERLRLELAGDLYRADNRNRQIGYGRDKLLASLSGGGSLVFSMTFLSALAPGKHWLSALFSAWILFGLSIGFVIIGMRMAELTELKVAQKLNERLREIEAHRNDDVQVSLRIEATRNPRGILFSNCAVGTFLAGVVCLGIFVGVNLACK